MKREICLLSEHNGKEITNVTRELMVLGTQLAEHSHMNLSALIIGHDLGDLSEFLLTHGIDRIYQADDKELATYSQCSYMSVISQMIQHHRPRFFLLGATTFGMDLAPRLSSKFAAGLISNVIDVEFDAEGNTVFIKPIYEGRLLAKMAFVQSDFNIVTVLPNYFSNEVKESPSGELIKMKVDPALEIRSKTMQVVRQESTEEADLSQADVIVAGGRGLGGQHGVEQLSNLAGLLGAAVGASRPAIEAGWLPYSSQIGLSGKTVRPKIYMALGISGAFQHLAGMKDSKCVIAVNKDAGAQIFNVADYGVVGDLHDVLPRLIKELEKRRGQSADT